MRLVSERESVFWQERVWFWLMGLTQICYMQTYNQEVLENNWGSKEKWTRSALSALGFRIGGQPQSLDYGGGDKSGLTDTRGRGSPFPPPSPEPRDGNQPVWCAWDQMCEDYGLETPTARAFFFFFFTVKSKRQSLKEAVTKKTSRQSTRWREKQKRRARDNRERRSIRVNTLSQITLLLSRPGRWHTIV